MSEETIQILINMGFKKEIAEKSVLITENKGIEPAVEWILSHNDEMEPLTFQEISDLNNTLEVYSPSSEAAVKSYRCDVCKNIFAENGAVDYHAVTSGHSTFSESTEEEKPSIDEERNEQIKKLKKILEVKHKEREAKKKEEELVKERTRIQSGKELSAAKRKLDDENIKKIMEKRKRNKQEEMIALDRVKAQIEADKLARKKLFNQVSGEEQPKKVSSVTVNPLKQSKNYTETKLQIRLTNSQTLIQTFDVKEMLSAVKVYIELNRSDGDAPFCLMTSFPKKVFSNDDYEKPLDQLGLVPSAVIILTKPPQ